jgi:serine/threonine protein kinase/tetratricopeptide (TPR) repeat protein
VLETIGHYRIRRLIGHGGMGVVYEGWDDRLQRAVAIKVIEEETENSAARGRIWREARSLASVNHPNVCQIYEVLEERELLVLVMELLVGYSLADHPHRVTMAASEALSIARQILHALQAIHDLGIVHRDLKPSNVFLTPHGVKLLDFGLARIANATQSNETIQTATTDSIPGVVVGTPAYMSPEQASGKPVGPASDIFSMGSVFYELLTGKRPFDGDSVVDVLYAVCHHNPPPLSGSREIEALDRIIRRAMSKRSDDRYASAGEMLAALEVITLSEVPVPAPRTSTVSRVIVLPFRALKSDEHTDFLTFSLPDAIGNSLSAINNLIIRSSFLAARFDGHPDPKRLAVEADVDAFLTGSLLRAGDRIRLTCQLIEAPSGTLLWSETANSSLGDLFTVQDELCEHILRSLQIPLDRGEGRAGRREVPATARAYECYLRGNQITMTRTLDNMSVARDLYLQCLSESPDFAPAWVRLGRVYHFLGKFGADLPTNEQLSEKAFSRAFALSPDLAIAHNFFTPAECDQGHARKAMIRLLERARFRRNDAELFAGLVQACRYCDELDASNAAHFRARHLDPNLATSVAHTHFLMGNYAGTLELYGNKGGYYLDCAALAALGENEKALMLLRERERTGGATGAVQGVMRSLRAHLEGRRDESLQAIISAESALLADPEVLLYAARQLARIDETEHAASFLNQALNRGFLWTSTVARDPWFSSLRSDPRYAVLAEAAEEQRSDTHAAFLTAGGVEVISIA